MKETLVAEGLVREMLYCRENGHLHRVHEETHQTVVDEAGNPMPDLLVGTCTYCNLMVVSSDRAQANYPESVRDALPAEDPHVWFSIIEGGHVITENPY